MYANLKVLVRDDLGGLVEEHSAWLVTTGSAGVTVHLDDEDNIDEPHREVRYPATYSVRVSADF